MNSGFDAQPSGTSRPEAVEINAALSVTLLVAANRTTESIMNIYCDTLTAKHKKHKPLGPGRPSSRAAGQAARLAALHLSLLTTPWGREGRPAALLARLLGWLPFI